MQFCVYHGSNAPLVITRFIRVIQRNKEKPEKHWIARTEPGNDQFFDITEIQPEMQFCVYHGSNAPFVITRLVRVIQRKM